MQKICQQAEEMLSELEGLPLSMARKLDPCELHELLFGKSYVNYEEAPKSGCISSSASMGNVMYELGKNA